MKYAIVQRDRDKSEEIANKIKADLKIEYSDENPDIVIAIGGDGTILLAAHKYPNSIIFGVHTGHLGFFANYSKEDLNILISDINNNTYKIDNLDILKFKVIDNDNKVVESFALNEVTIVSPPRTLRLDVSIDGEYFERFRGTGFCISTPYGSTAYNKSLDGGVVDTTLSLMQVTEIAGINSNSYRTLSSPLILSSERTIKFESEKDAEVFITADHISYEINTFKSLEINYLKGKLKMGYHKEGSFLTRINRTFLISKD